METNYQLEKEYIESYRKPSKIVAFFWSGAVLLALAGVVIAIYGILYLILSVI